MHLVDIAPLDQVQPEDAVRKLQQELINFDSSLGDKPRWLVFTKTDVIDQTEAQEIAERVAKDLNWDTPWFMISSVTRSGTDELMQSIGRALDEMKELETEQEKEWSLESGDQDP